MNALYTPAPAKLASSGGGGRPARCGGRGFRTGPDRVPADSAWSCLQNPIFLPEPCVTFGPKKIPTEFRPSDVKVPAFECLCAGVVERPRSAECSQVAASPTWPYALARRHQTPSASKAMVPSVRQRPHQESGGEDASPAPVADTSVVVAWTARSRFPLSPGGKPRRLHRAVSARKSRGGDLTSTRPPPPSPDSALSLRLAQGPSLRSRHERGLDVEETRSPITHHRADNSRRAGDPPLGREQAPRATAISPEAAGPENPSGDPREGRCHGP
jgi:hypothetical protein